MKTSRVNTAAVTTGGRQPLISVREVTYVHSRRLASTHDETGLSFYCSGEQAANLRDALALAFPVDDTPTVLVPLAKVAAMVQDLRGEYDEGWRVSNLEIIQELEAGLEDLAEGASS